MDELDFDDILDVVSEEQATKWNQQLRQMMDIDEKVVSTELSASKEQSFEQMLLDD